MPSRSTVLAVLAGIALLLGFLSGGVRGVHAQLANTFPTTIAVVPGGTLTLAVTTPGVLITGTSSLSTCTATPPPPAATVTYTCSGGLSSGTLISQTFSVPGGPIAETVTYNANGPATAFAAVPNATTGSDSVPCTLVSIPFIVEQFATCSGTTSAQATIPGGTLKVYVGGELAGVTVNITDYPKIIGTCGVSDIYPTDQGYQVIQYRCKVGQSVPAGTSVNLIVSVTATTATATVLAPKLTITDNYNAPVPAAPAPVSQNLTVGTGPAPTLASINPPSGPAGTSVTLTGSNLGGATAINFGTTPGTNLTCATATSCTVNAPALAPNTAANVTVVTPNGTSNALTFTFTAAAATGQSVSFPAGWNIVSGPAGMSFNQCSGPLYTYQAGDASSGYEMLPNSGGISSGRGYWCYFDAPTTVSLTGAGTTTASIPAPAGQYVMVGNPSSTSSVTVRGADAVYQFDPSLNTYVAVTVLAPGRGAFAISSNGGTITVGP